MTTKGAQRWNECKFTRWFCRCIARCNGRTFAVVGSKMQEPGWPDRYVVHKRWHGWIEFKHGSNRLSEIQRAVCTDLDRCGVNVLIGRIRPNEFFDLCRVDGRTLIQQNIRPLIGDDQKAGLKFLEMLEKTTELLPSEHSPFCR